MKLKELIRQLRPDTIIVLYRLWDGFPMILAEDKSYHLQESEYAEMIIGNIQALECSVIGVDIMGDFT